MSTTTFDSSLIDQLAKVIPFDRRILTLEGVAEYLQCSVSQARQRYIALPDFPPAIRLPTGGKNGRPMLRWRAVDVERWVLSYREKS